MNDRIRVRLKQDHRDTCLAWATPAEDGNGFILEWDDGYPTKDDRWHFYGTGRFDIEEVV